MEESTGRAERQLPLLSKRSDSGSEPLQNANTHCHRMSPGPKVRMDPKKTSGQMYSGVVTNFHVLDAPSSLGGSQDMKKVQPKDRSHHACPTS